VVLWLDAVEKIRGTKRSRVFVMVAAWASRGAACCAPTKSKAGWL